MHEFTLAEQILTCALDLSREYADAPVERIDVEIGALQAVVPESLRFAFEAAVQGTAAEGAELAWKEKAAVVECEACALTYSPADIIWSCPACGAPGGRVIQGDELNILRVVLGEVTSVEAPAPTE